MFDFRFCLRFFGRSQLQEDIFETKTYRFQFVQVQACVDHRARQFGPNRAALQAFDFKSAAIVLGVFEDHAADAGHLLETLPYIAMVQSAIGALNFERHLLGPTPASPG